MAAEKKKKVEEAVIYIGPNLGRGRLLAYTVFRSGIPEHLKDLREQNPEMDTLMIPVSDLKHGIANIKRTGTAENLAFQSLKEANTNGL